jgi:hypothetical protein
MNEILQLQEKLRNLQKEIREKSASAFASGVAPLFASQPILQSFSWTQYTPYFNDGEQCEFSANTDYLHLEYVDGTSDDDFSLSSHEWKLKRGGDYSGRAYTANEHNLAGAAVAEFLQQFDQDTLKFMFGDHVRITVDRDGNVTTDEYDHE